MTLQHDQSRTSTAASPSSPDRDEQEPGRASSSALLRKPDHAIVSGLLSRKARDANGVAEGADSAVANASSSVGSPLPETLQRKFESSLGADLSAVRVHTGESSAAANDAVGAKAYTTGNDIHFAAGQYDPTSPQGEHLLAHEVAHTVQQSGGAQRVQFKLAVSSPSDTQEHEADSAADAMVAGQHASVSGASKGIHRAFAVETEKNVDPERKDAIATLEAEPDKVKADWIKLGGPDLMACVLGDVIAWNAYRALPTKAEKMPRKSTLAALMKFDTLAVTPAMREYASRELGTEHLRTLEELMVMNRQCFELPRVFNIKNYDVTHKYEVKFTSGGEATLATITYTNNLRHKPWSWESPPIAITGFSFNVNLLDPSEVATAGLGVSGSMKSDKNNQHSYWGWDDFNGGVNVANWPSAGVESSVGGVELATGTTVLFTGGPGGQLGFHDFSIGISGTAPEPKKGNKVKAGYKIGFGGGMGFAGVGSDKLAKVATKDISKKAQLIDAQKEFRARITNFANASAALPSTADADLKKLIELIRAFGENEFTEPSHAAGFRSNGLDPEQAFKPAITIEGWASARWIDAKNDADRAKRNHELSEQRANAAATSLLGQWGPWTYSALSVVGRGEGINTPGTNQAETATSAKQKLEIINHALAGKRKRLEAAKASKDAVAVEQLQPEIDALEVEQAKYASLLAPDGTTKSEPYESWIRQVVITVRWNGKLVDLASTGASGNPGAAAEGSGGGNVLKEPNPSWTLKDYD